MRVCVEPTIEKQQLMLGNTVYSTWPSLLETIRATLHAAEAIWPEAGNYVIAHKMALAKPEPKKK